MSDLSPEEARQYIEERREKNGGIGSEDKEYLENHRPAVLRALKNTRRQLANSIKV